MRPPSPIPKKRTCFNAEAETLKTFKETVKREGADMSSKLNDFMRNYNQAHSLGNPQLRLSVYVKPEEPQPMRVLCSFIEGAVSDGHVFCRKRGMWVGGLVCYSCDRNRLRKQKK